MPFFYLDAMLMEKMCHPIAVALFKERGEPIPMFAEHSVQKLEASLSSPRQAFGGQEVYPTLEEKAAILFYSLIQNHCFPNGNKRISTATLLVFLYMNGHWLNASSAELAEWAIRIASSGEKNPPEKINDIMPQLIAWLQKHLIVADF